MTARSGERALIESDAFPFEFLSCLAERESWRKEIHRPVYHVHKWWAKRLGSVFRGILLGCVLPVDADFSDEFYRMHDFASRSVLDPFMGSGTTVGEAHKLGMTALGRDINPVAVDAVATALGPLDRNELLDGFQQVEEKVGPRIRALYRTLDSRGMPCDTLYYFWVMQAPCLACGRDVDLFSSYVVARNANPNRRRLVQVVCPRCGDIQPMELVDTRVECSKCRHEFDVREAPATGGKAQCNHCANEFAILDAVKPLKARPRYRLYGKLVLTAGGDKEYLKASDEDLAAYEACSEKLKREITVGNVRLPELRLEYGYNTRQAMAYGFNTWKDFFNDRQALALSWLRNAINETIAGPARVALLTLFSGVLEFNNLFASYKGEGTGAVRHMFSHHILKPERTPIEANVWGTPKSSGAFSTLFRTRLLRAVEYREMPTEVNGRNGRPKVCGMPFTGRIESRWPVEGGMTPRGIYLSCGDSASLGLSDCAVDFVVTDPPFFDNVHYSELADFFYAWRQCDPDSRREGAVSTRSSAEVQDSNPDRFAQKLQAVFRESHRVLKDDGLLVFTYHHSRNEGWESLATALLGVGFTVVNAHPVKSEMSVATPKSQAKEPIQLDMILVCRKFDRTPREEAPSVPTATLLAQAKIERLWQAGLRLSRNDQKIVLQGQLLTGLRSSSGLAERFAAIDTVLDEMQSARPICRADGQQRLLFD